MAQDSGSQGSGTPDKPQRPADAQHAAGRAGSNPQASKPAAAGGGRGGIAKAAKTHGAGYIAGKAAGKMTGAKKGQAQGKVSAAASGAASGAVTGAMRGGLHGAAVGAAKGTAKQSLRAANDRRKERKAADKDEPRLGAAGTSAIGDDAKKQEDDRALGDDEGATKSSLGKKVVLGASSIPALALAAQVAVLAMFAKLLKMAIAAAQMMTQSFLAWLGNFLLSIGKAIISPFLAVGSAVASVVGAGASIPVAVATGLVTVGSLVATGAGLIQDSIAQQEIMRDGDLQVTCTPMDRAGAQQAEAIETDGQTDAQAEMAYAFLAGLEMPEENIAGILGNWSAESSLDPTAVETIFDEPFQIGPRKQAAWDANWDIRTVNPGYAAQYPAINQMGVGLGQWTNGRNTLLMNFADRIDRPWYEIETQLGFMMTDDDRSDYMQEILTTPLGTPAEATMDFMSRWEGLHDSTGPNRINAAERYMGMFGGWDADEELANSILDAAGAAGDIATGGAQRAAFASAINCDGEDGENSQRVMNLEDAVCAEPGTGVPDFGYGGPIENVLHPNAHDAFLCGWGTWGPENDGQLHSWHSYRPAGTGIGAGNSSDHTFGAALDISTTHIMDTKEGQEYGRDVAEWYMQHAEELNVKMVIYWEKVWLPEHGQRPYEEWEQYPQAWCSSPPWSYMGSDFPVSVTPGQASHNCSHRNHIHVSVNHDGIDHNM